MYAANILMYRYLLNNSEMYVKNKDIIPYLEHYINLY